MIYHRYFERQCEFVTKIMKNKKEVAIFISVIYGLRQVFSSRVKGIEHSEEKVTRCEEQQLKGRCVCVCVSNRV